MKERLIIFPTDTVYGIGASVFDKESMDKIYEIKKRPKDKPLAVLCYDINQIENIAVIDDRTRKIIQKFLPGPLTLIVKARMNIKETMGLDMVGVRIPNSKTALEILNRLGPMATTSVNESGMMPINEYETILNKYSHVVDKIYPKSETSSNISSTVILISDEIKLIRQGEISLDDILKIK